MSVAAISGLPLLSRFQLIERGRSKNRDQDTDTNVQVIAITQSHRDQKYTKDDDCDLRKHAVTPIGFERLLGANSKNYSSEHATVASRQEAAANWQRHLVNLQDFRESSCSGQKQVFRSRIHSRYSLTLDFARHLECSR